MSPKTVQSSHSEHPLFARKLMVFFDPDRVPCSMMLSKDQSLLAVCYVDGTLRLIEPESGAVRTLPRRHTKRCPTLTFSQDGSRLLSPCLEGCVRIWDTKTGQQVKKFELLGYAGSGEFSPDEKFIATGMAGPTFYTQFWDMETGERIASFKKHAGFVAGFEFLDNERVLSFAADKTPYLLNTKTGDILRAFKGHRGMVYSGEVSPDKTRLVTSSEDQTIRIWNLLDEAEKPTVLKGHDAPVSFVAYTPDGHGLISGDGRGIIRLWNLDTGRSVRQFEAHTEMIVTLKLSKDGKRFLSAGMDGKVILWDIETELPLCIADCETPVPYTNFTKGEQGFVTLGEATGVIVWELTTEQIAISEEPRQLVLPEPIVDTQPMDEEDQERQVIIKLDAVLEQHAAETEPVSSLTSRDGKYLLQVDNEPNMRLYNRPMQKCLHDFAKTCDVRTASFIGKSHCFFVVRLADEPKIEIWNAETVAKLNEFGSFGSDYSYRPKKIIVDSSEKLLLCAAEKGGAKLYEIETGKLLQSFGDPEQPVGEIAFYPDSSKVVLSMLNCHICVWDVKTGARSYQSNRLEVFNIKSIAVAEDGKITVRDMTRKQVVVDPSEPDVSDIDKQGMAAVPLSPCKTAQPLILSSVRGPILKIIVSQDGSQLATLGTASDIRVYDTKTWNLLTHCNLPTRTKEEGRDSTHDIQFSPDGKTIYEINENFMRHYAVPGPDGEIRDIVSWQLPSAKDNDYTFWIKGRAISPDASKVLICGEGHIAQLLESDTGKLVAEFSLKNKRYELYDPIFSPDGRRAVMVNSGSTLFVLDLETKKVLDIPLPKLEARPLGWSPDGKLLMVRVKKKLLFLDSTNGSVVREISVSKGEAAFAALSPDQNYLLLGNYQYEASYLQLQRFDSGQVLLEKETQSGVRTTFYLPSLFFDNGNRLAVGGCDLSIVETKTYHEKKRLEGHPIGFSPAVFLHDEQVVLFSDGGTGRFFDTNTGKETGRMDGFFGCDYANCVSPNGKYLAVDWKSGVQIFDLQTKKLVKSVPEFGTKCGLVVAPDFSTFIAGKKNDRVVYRLPGVNKLFSFSGINEKTPEKIVFTRDSKCFLVSDWSPGVRLYDAQTGQVLKELDLSDTQAHTPKTGFLGDESRFYVTLKSGELGIYDTATFEQVDKLTFGDNAFSMFTISPDGTLGATDEFLQRADVFNMQTGKIIRTDPLGDKELSCFVADFPRNRLFYGGVDGTIRVLRTTDWVWTHRIEGIGKKVNRLFISQDGDRLASQHLDAIDVFETKTFSRIATLPVPSNRTMPMWPVVQFSPSFRFAVRLDDIERNAIIFEV